MSRIPNLNSFYEGCLFMSIKTSNNQEIIDRMPFNRYLKLTEALNKYVEMENKANNGESTGNETQNQMDEVKASSEDMMNKARTSFKMPSLPKFK